MIDTAYRGAHQGALGYCGDGRVTRDHAGDHFRQGKQRALADGG